MGTARFGLSLQHFPGYSSELQEVWLAPTQDTPGHLRGPSPEAPCSLSQTLKIKLPGHSYSGLSAEQSPGKERGSQVSRLGQRRGQGRKEGEELQMELQQWH